MRFHIKRSMHADGNVTNRFSVKSYTPEHVLANTATRSNIVRVSGPVQIFQNDICGLRVSNDWQPAIINKVGDGGKSQNSQIYFQKVTA